MFFDDRDRDPHYDRGYDRRGSSSGEDIIETYVMIFIGAAVTVVVIGAVLFFGGGFIDNLLGTDIVGWLNSVLPEWIPRIGMEEAPGGE